MGMTYVGLLGSLPLLRAARENLAFAAVIRSSPLTYSVACGWVWNYMDC